MNNLNVEKSLTDPLSLEMLQFEKDIAYFFGVKDQELVAKHYVRAVELYELLKAELSEQKMQEQLLPHFILAYQEVAKQTGRDFDIKKAAHLEWELAMVFDRGLSFEASCQILVEIYQTVYQESSPQIDKAAMIRTFLYQYKNDIFKKTGHLSIKDRKTILHLASLSTSELDIYHINPS